MKIIQINTSDIAGGAAKAAYRLHKGLIQINRDSVMLVRSKESGDRSVYSISALEADEDLHQFCLSSIQDSYIDRNRTSLSNTLFSLPYLGYDLTTIHDVVSADIINLHWVANFQSIATINKLLSLKKPIVWTLHDMWAFTGGCHYASSCTKYQQDCVNCPQLQEDPYHLTSAILKDKIELLAKLNLTIVSPSNWLAECASKSRLFQSNRIEVIPNSLETDIFVPLPKPESKPSLGLDSSNITLLIGADNGNEKRKGFLELLKALKIFIDKPQIKDLVQENKIKLLCFGVPNEQLQDLELPIISLGSINCDRKLCEIYSAADLFILPSLEDNLPNTMLEAMACETPVVAFNVGGIAEVVRDRVTGRLILLGDIHQLAEAIADCVISTDERKRIGKNCRRAIEENHSQSLQAKRYINLYQDLLSSFNSSSCLSSFSSRKAGAISEAIKITVPTETTSGKNLDIIYDNILCNPILKAIAREKQLLQELQAESANVRYALLHTQIQLKQAQEKIAAMKTSKFWKLRTVWFKFKTLIGFPTDRS